MHFIPNHNFFHVDYTLSKIALKKKNSSTLRKTLEIKLQTEKLSDFESAQRRKTLLVMSFAELSDMS